MLDKRQIYETIMSDVVFCHSCVCYSSFQPIRVCVLGPPAVGKSTVCEYICQHYKLHHISLKEIVSETISQLVSFAQTTHI